VAKVTHRKLFVYLLREIISEKHKARFDSRWLGNAGPISNIFCDVCNHSNNFGNQGIPWTFDAKRGWWD
jgi:hypothetical protein